MNSIFFSCVIPAFNEEKRMETTLSKVKAFLCRQPYPSEIIVVDDGSTDATSNLAKKILEPFSHQILCNPKNLGKGFAVRRGILAARGEYLLFSDADLSTPIEEWPRFLEKLKEGFDVVIGSRALPDSKVEIHQKILRESMGKTFNRIATLLTFQGIRDSQCGFKGFTRKAGRELFQRQRLNGFSFDAEILFLAQRLGYRILELPVTWRNSPQSRVNLLRDPAAMFLDLLRIRMIHH